MNLSRRNAVPNPQTAGKGASLLGGFSTLLEQIGPGVTAPVELPSLPLPQVRNLPDLHCFLEAYFTRFLPLELPLILRARDYAVAGKARELIVLDQEVSQKPELLAFPGASRRIGQAQLQHLRPLRDQRVAQRFLASVDAGEAAGWHALVYGLILAIYSLPLRQGLLHYAEGTLHGLAMAAARSLHLPEPDCHTVVNQLTARLPEMVESVLARQAAGIGISR